MSNIFKDIVSEGKDKSKAQDLKDTGEEANAKIGQVGFSLIKNMINDGDDITHSDVTSYLQKADDINDEVDTVVFGLETDNDEIIKVYVAVDDAEEFEKAMAERLGTEDDIDDVIAELAEKFDIVDVEWPDGEDEDEEDADNSDTSTVKKGEEEPTAEINFDTTPTGKPVEESMTTLHELLVQESKQVLEGEQSPLAKGEFNWPPEIESLSRNLTTLGAKSALYALTKFELPPEVLSSKKAFGQFKQNLIAVGRSYQKNQTLKIWINKFISELEPKKDPKGKTKVEESAKLSKEESLAPEWDDPKLMKAGKFRDTLPRGIPRLIFDVMIGLGMPSVMLTDINKSKVRESIRTFTHKLRQNQRLRIYLKLIAETLNIKREDQSEAASSLAKKASVTEEVILEASTDDYSGLVRELLIELGVPAENVNYKEAQVIQSFRKRKTQLNTLAVMKRIQMFLTFLKKNELKSVNEASAAQNYFALVNELGQLLGFPAGHMRYKEQQVVHAINKRKLQINAATVAARLEKLIEFVRASEIGGKEVVESISSRAKTGLGIVEVSGVEEPISEASEADVELDQILKTTSKAKSKLPEAADVGKWSFSSLGNDGGVTLKAKGVTIKLAMDVAEKVVASMADAKPVTVKTANSKKIVFSPRNRGTEYVIAGIDKFDNGVLMTKTDVNKFLDSL